MVEGAAAVRLGAHRHRSADHQLLVRRSLARMRRASLSWRSSAAGRPARSPCPSWPPLPGRVGIEDCFGEAKNEAGLDHYQVRKYRAGTGTSPCPCSRTRSSPSPPWPCGRTTGTPSRQRGTSGASTLKGGPEARGKAFAPPRAYAPPPFITSENGRELIPLTAAGARRLFNLHVHVTRPRAFHQQWSDWRRYRQAAARKSHNARRTEK